MTARACMNAQDACTCPRSHARRPRRNPAGSRISPACPACTRQALRLGRDEVNDPNSPPTPSRRHVRRPGRTVASKVGMRGAEGRLPRRVQHRV
jgi:hypothetical protein